MPKAKWTGKHTQRVPGVGLFEPHTERDVTDEQVNLLIGVGTSDQGKYLIKPSESTTASTPKGKAEKQKE